MLMLVFGMLGLGVGGDMGGGVGAVVGMLFGAVSTWFAISLDKLIAAKDSRDICNSPSSGKPPEDSAGT